MEYNRKVRVEEKRHGIAAGIGLVGLTTAMVACGVVSGGKTTERTPRPQAATGMPADRHLSSRKTDVFRVCDGIYTQRLTGNDVEVIGRPIVDGNNIPQVVEVSRYGIESAARTLSDTDHVQWYTLQGHPVGENEVSCQMQQLSTMRIRQPHGAIWVAATNIRTTSPRIWDVHALNPEGFGGVHLDYGHMSMAGLGQVLDAAAR